MKCDIIIPIWNQLDHTRQCVEHIVKNTSYPYRLILIDNASDAETRAYLEGIAKPGALGKDIEVRLIRNNENAGFVKAVNQGMKLSDAPYICVFNNDTIPASGWLERMIDFAANHDDVGLVNPVCGGHGDKPIDAYAKELAKNKDKYMEMNQCQGFCMLVKRELINKIGYLDEVFGIGGYDDTDYSMRAHHAGYRSVAIHDAYVYHRIHASFDKAGNREHWVRRNQKIYYKKWGKHLRAGVAMSFAGNDVMTLQKAILFAYGLAREWTWVHLWINTAAGAKKLDEMVKAILEKKGLAPHQNIRIDHFNLPKALFGLTLSGKLVERIRKRMRDKRFDAVVILDDAAAGPVALCAKAVNTFVERLSVQDECDDWLKRGKETALSIKEKQKKYA